MTKKLTIIFICLFGFILRFYLLGINPPALDWDEASLGYNAFSILKTGSDEYGHFLPVSFESFGDYKPPIYVYLSTFPISILGLNEISTRITSAIFGTISILIVYLLVVELLGERSQKIPLLSTFFFAISPWHIQFSRVAFEANSSLFFLIFGVYLFLRGLKKSKFILISALMFTLSIYAYHSPRLIIPLLFLFLFIIFRAEIFSKIKWFLISFAILSILVLPIIIDLKSSTAARLGSVSILNTPQSLTTSIKDIQYDKQNGFIVGSFLHNRRIEYTKDFLTGYLNHINFDFLFLTGDGPGRHHAVDMGMLYLWDAPFIIVGIFYLLARRNKYIHTLLIWFGLAPIAAAFTTGTPHAVRALFYLPLYQIFSATGALYALFYLKRTVKGRLYIAMSLFIPALLIINFFYYLNMYWVHTPQEYSEWWQYGYKEIVQEVQKVQNRYNQIIVTYKYDQPYVFFLFYDQIDPYWYQNNWNKEVIGRTNRGFGKFLFRKIKWSTDSKLTNTLIIGAPEEIPADAKGITREIHFLDGSVAFRIVAL